MDAAQLCPRDPACRWHNPQRCGSAARKDRRMQPLTVLSGSITGMTICIGCQTSKGTAGFSYTQSPDAVRLRELCRATNFPIISNCRRLYQELWLGKKYLCFGDRPFHLFYELILLTNWSRLVWWITRRAFFRRYAKRSKIGCCYR